MQTIFIIAGFALTGIWLLLISKKIKTMSTLKERSDADIATILAVILAIGGDIGTIAQEITDLKNNEASGQDQADTVAKLDDLAAKATAAAAALHALVPVDAATPPAGDGETAPVTDETQQ